MLKKEIKLCLLIIFLCALVGTAGILVADNRTRQVGFADSFPPPLRLFGSKAGTES